MAQGTAAARRKWWRRFRRPPLEISCALLHGATAAEVQDLLVRNGVSAGRAAGILLHLSESFDFRPSGSDYTVLRWTRGQEIVRIRVILGIADS